MGRPNSDTGGEFPSAAVRPEPGQDGSLWVWKTAAFDAPDEFATSVTVDTGGEFPLAVDRPELGQDGSRWVRKTAVPVAPDEFATSVTVGSTPRSG